MERMVGYQIDENGVALVRLNNPPVNALIQEVKERLEMVFDEMMAREEIRAVILTGGDKVFAAGGDIKAFPNLNPTSSRLMVLKSQVMLLKIENFPTPVIAAIEGRCWGGGCEIALCCDIRVASEGATFGQPEVNLAIMPGAGGTQRLPRLIGSGKAKEMIFTGRILSSKEAMEIGLVEKIVPAGKTLEGAREMAAEILKKGPVAIKMAKKAINLGMRLPFMEGLQVEADCFSYLFGTEDKDEGAKAFLEKRIPQYKGR